MLFKTPPRKLVQLVYNLQTTDKTPTARLHGFSYDQVEDQFMVRYLSSETDDKELHRFEMALNYCFDEGYLTKPPQIRVTANGMRYLRWEYRLDGWLSFLRDSFIPTTIVSGIVSFFVSIVVYIITQ